MGDKKIKCIDCYKDFIFTENEQQFFEDKGYSEPIRCKDCRSKKKTQKRPSGFR
jgi:DNA-directed RNA polymerase subunit RPC12/RpoP